jgi:hypothetical protein
MPSRSLFLNVNINVQKLVLTAHTTFMQLLIKKQITISNKGAPIPPLRSSIHPPQLNPRHSPPAYNLHRFGQRAHSHEGVTLMGGTQSASSTVPSHLGVPPTIPTNMPNTNYFSLKDHQIQQYPDDDNGKLINKTES